MQFKYRSSQNYHLFILSSENIRILVVIDFNGHHNFWKSWHFRSEMGHFRLYISFTLTTRLQNLIYPRRNLYINEANIIQLTLRSRLG